MLTIERHPTLPAGWQATVTNLVHDAMHVTLSARESSFTLRLVPHPAHGIRLEEFQPESVDPAALLPFSQALQALLTPMDWQYAVALYPLAWRSVFERLGFHHLSERLRWEIRLGPELPEQTLPATVHITPFTPSAEHLGRLLRAAEEDPSLSLARCTALCRELLEGAYGPLLTRGCGEIAIGEVVVGACIFTNYFAEPLVGHIFLDKSVQGRGYARLLLQHCLAGLRLEGFTRAIASTDATNLASQRLHARTGFTRVNPDLRCSLVTRADWKKGEAQ